MDGMIDRPRPSDVSTSFKHYLPSLCSPVVAVTNRSENVDEAWMPVVFRSCSSPALLAVILAPG